MNDVIDVVILEENQAGGADGGDKKPLSRNIRLIIGIAAALVLAAMGVLIPMLVNTEEPVELAISVFSGGVTQVTLKPGVETAISASIAVGNEVPGYPLRIDAGGTEKVGVSADGGSLVTWSAADNTTTNRGSSCEIASGETVFWSPYENSDDNAGADPVPQCTLTVTARRAGTDIAQARLIVRQTGDTGYSVTLLASE